MARLAVILVCCALLAPTCAAQPETDPVWTEIRSSAFTAKKKGEFSKAADLFLKLVAHDPSDSDLPLQAAACLEKAARYNDALDCLETARKRFPDVLAFSVGIAKNLNLKAYHQLKTTGKFDAHIALTFEDCIREATKVLGKHPDNRDIRLIKASTHYRLAQFDKAKAEADELVKRFPQHPGAYILLGDLAFDGYKVLRQQMTKKGADTSKEALQKVTAARDLALKHFNKAVTLDPKRVAAWIQLGNIQAWNGNRMLALQHFKRALSIRPGASVPHGWIGTNVGHTERAKFYLECEAAFQRGGGSEKDSAILAWQAASAHYAESKWQAAEDLFVRSGLANPDFSNAGWWAMWCAINREDHDRAAIYCAFYAQRAPRTFSDHVRALKPQSTQDTLVLRIERYAFKAYKAGNFGGSRDINHVLAFVRQTGKAWNNYGFLSRETKRYKQSLEGYENALAADRDNGQIMNDMAVILDFHLGTAEQIRAAEAVFRKDLKAAGRYIPEPDYDLSDDKVVGARAKANLRRAAKLYRDAIKAATKALRNKNLIGEERKIIEVAKRDATNNLRALRKRLK